MKVHGKERYTTCLGVLLTFFCILILLAGSYGFGQALFDKTSPEVIINAQILENYDEMDLYEHGLIPTFGLSKGQTKETGIGFASTTEIFRYVTIVGVIMTLDYKDIKENVKVTELIQVPFVSCNETNPEFFKKFIKKTDVANNFLRKYNLCPKLQNNSKWKVKGVLTSPPYSFIRMYIFPCSLPEAFCIKKELLVNSKIKFGMMNKMVTFGNKKEPLGNVMNFDQEYFLNPKHLAKFAIYFKRNVIKDDEYDLMEPSLISSFIDQDKTVTTTGFRDGSVHCTLETIMGQTCLPYIIFDFKAGSKLQTISRSYEKILATISELGGYIEFTFMVFGILYFSYNSFFFIRFMKKQIIPLEKKQLEKLLQIKDKKSKEELNNAIDTIYKRNIDAVSLINNINEISLLKEVLFKNHHSELLPEVLIFLSKNEKIKKKNTIVQSGKLAKSKELIAAYNALKNSKPKTSIKKLVKKYFLKHLPNQQNEFEEFANSLTKL